MLKRIKQTYNTATIEETNEFGYKPMQELIDDPTKTLAEVKRDIELQNAFKGMH